MRFERYLRALGRPRHIARRLSHELLVLRFQRLVRKLPPVQVDADGEIEVHMLFGKRGMHDAIAAAKSFYRFAPRAYPLVVHEDGSLDAEARAFLQRHLPGTRVIDRAEADARVGEELRRRGLRLCSDLRSRLIFSLKYFDLQLYAAGKSVLYLDADILFHRRPDELIAALERPAAEWVDRYNVDIMSSYAWPQDEVAAVTGVRIESRVNAGLVCFRRTELDWTLAERCLTLGHGNIHYAEQTLWALDLATHGARPLPDDYDVCFRDTWRGGDYDAWLETAEGGANAVSQHYCGGIAQRAYFYRHFIREAGSMGEALSP